MISELHIKGFRCFEHLRVPGLTRVNLIVGKNNSGKTSLLEAVEVHHIGTRALTRGPLRRREEIRTDPDGTPELDVSHLFHGHHLDGGARFTIQAVGSNLDFDCRVVREDDPSGLPGDETLVLEITRLLTFESMPPGSPLERVQLSYARGLGEAWRRVPGSEVELELQWLGPGTPNMHGLARLWGLVALTEEEPRVYELLRASGLNVEGIAFTALGERAGPGTFVRVAGAKNRLPLGSLGDGVQRLLALALHLVASRGGVLLVDEIDTGLHHSVMTRMWRLVIETARRLDVQVFATTHSEDCVRSLAEAAEQDADAAADVSLHRIDPGEHETMRYSSDELSIATRGHIEVR